MQHLKMKFQMKTRVGEVRREQVLAQECYVQELRQGQKEVSIVEPEEGSSMVFPPPPQILMIEAKTRDEGALKLGEADEPLELVTFDSFHPEGYVKIGTRLTKEERQQLTNLLLEHKNVFEWSHKHMPGQAQVECISKSTPGQVEEKEFWHGKV